MRTRRFLLAAATCAFPFACNRPATPPPPESGGAPTAMIVRQMDSIVRADRDSIDRQYTRLFASAPHLARVIALQQAAYAGREVCITRCTRVHVVNLGNLLTPDSAVCPNSLGDRIKRCAQSSGSDYDDCMTGALSGGLCRP